MSAKSVRVGGRSLCPVPKRIIIRPQSYRPQTLTPPPYSLQDFPPVRNRKVPTHLQHPYKVQSTTLDTPRTPSTTTTTTTAQKSQNSPSNSAAHPPTRILLPLRQPLLCCRSYGDASSPFHLPTAFPTCRLSQPHVAVFVDSTPRTLIPVGLCLLQATGRQSGFTSGGSRCSQGTPSRSHLPYLER